MKAWLPVALLWLVSCNQPRFDRPEEAYRSFSGALRRGEVKAAYEALSAPTRAAIEARSKAVAAASAGSVRDEPMLMFFASGYKPLPQGELKVAKQDGQTAVVEIVFGDAGPSHFQPMVKEGDRWAVDLTEAFK